MSTNFLGANLTVIRELTHLVAARLLVESDYQLLATEDRALLVEHLESGKKLMIGVMECE